MHIILLFSCYSVRNREVITVEGEFERHNQGLKMKKSKKKMMMETTHQYNLYEHHTDLEL